MQCGAVTIVTSPALGAVRPIDFRKPFDTRRDEANHLIWITGLSFNLLALLFLAHSFIPKARPHTTKFFNLSYYNADSGKYRTGFDDAYFIAFCITAFTGLRAATMEYLLAPLAKLQGVTERKTLTRFSEQAWLLVYYSFFWTLGAVCLSH